MRLFEFVMKDEEKVYPDAKLPVYMTKQSAGADFYCAEEVVVPPAKVVKISEGDIEEFALDAKPTLVHTGICCRLMESDCLELFNRSGNPNAGLVLANGVGVVDADYYNSESNGGEIMFAFYNFSKKPIKIDVGQRIGQGVIHSYHKVDNAIVVDNDRSGAFGSTGVM